MTVYLVICLGAAQFFPDVLNSAPVINVGITVISAILAINVVADAVPFLRIAMVAIRGGRQ